MRTILMFQLLWGARSVMLCFIRGEGQSHVMFHSWWGQSLVMFHSWWGQSLVMFHSWSGAKPCFIDGEGQSHVSFMVGAKSCYVSFMVRGKVTIKTVSTNYNCCKRAWSRSMERIGPHSCNRRRSWNWGDRLIEWTLYENYEEKERGWGLGVGWAYPNVSMIPETDGAFQGVERGPFFP